jgi:transposase InsO family protein
MADDLTTDDIVVIKDRWLRFMEKPEGQPHLFYDDKSKQFVPYWTTELLRFQVDRLYHRPGRRTSAFGGASDEKERGKLKEIEAQRSAHLRLAYLAFPSTVRARSDVKWRYVTHFRNEMLLAEAGGLKFDRNKENAEAVIEAVDAQIDKLNKNEKKPEKHIIKPDRSPRSLLRWVARELSMKIQQSSLLHGNAVRRHERKLPQTVFDIIARETRNLVEISPKLGPTKIKIVVDAAIEEYNFKNKANLPKPQLTTVQNEYRRFDAWIRLAKEKGTKQADLEFGAIGKLVRPARILDLVELDHHKFDLHGIFGKTPLGKAMSTGGRDRFWVCLALDVHSGYPLGFAITFEPGGFLPALMCVENSVHAKTYVRKRWPDINGDLLAFGKPVRIRYDNAKEFVSLQMQSALARIGVGFQMAIPGQPQTKPYVERHFGTIERDFVHWLKGSTGSNPKEKVGRNPVQEAIIPWDDFVKMFHRYLIECYARRKQPGLDWDTPEERWMRGATNAAHRPRPLTDYEEGRFDNIMSIEVPVKATDEGFVWNRLTFQSTDLQAIRRRSGDFGLRKKSPTKLIARIPLLDVGTAHVADPTAHQTGDPNIPSEITVHCTNPHARKRTNWQHEVVCGYLLSKKKSPTSHADYRAGFVALFREALHKMGATPMDEEPKKSSLSGGDAPRFASVFLGGVQEHALKRTEDEITRHDMFGEIERALKEKTSKRKASAPVPSKRKEWKTDPIKGHGREEQGANGTENGAAATDEKDDGHE